MQKSYIIFCFFISFLLMIALPAQGVAQTAANPQIVSNLKILELPPYKVGQTITAEFIIRNAGTDPITFDVLTVGGRLNGECPQNKCPDFEFKHNVFLPPKGSYTYRGRLMLRASGNYHFFTAYRTKDGRWNTAIPTIPGVINIANIIVESGDPCAQYYGKGYCTDYIKTKVNIPWSGDAITWLDQARRHGYRTGSETRAGSIAVLSYAMPFGHVAWVDDVLPDGSFVVSHWNWSDKWKDKRCGVTEMFGKLSTKRFSKNDPQLRGFIYP